VKQDPLSVRNVGLPSSMDDKDKVHSSDAKDLENSDGSKDYDNGKPEETKNVESVPPAYIASPIESTQVDANNSDTNGS
jgi:hypothetical protein